MFSTYPSPLPALTSDDLESNMQDALHRLKTSAWIGNLHPGIKQYKVYDLPEDLLALSMAWYRIRKTEPTIRITRLLDTELFDQVTNEDRIQADIVRDYYSKKIMLWKLKDQLLTKYREDLNLFIHSDKKRAHQESMFGLAYRLPEMHAFDIQMDELRLDIESIPENQSQLHVSMNWILVPNRVLIYKTRSSNIHQFWFKNCDGNGVLLKVPSNHNQLLPTWNKLFNTSKYMHIAGLPRKKTRDGFSYIQIEKWSCEKFDLG